MNLTPHRLWYKRSLNFISLILSKKIKYVNSIGIYTLLIIVSKN